MAELAIGTYPHAGAGSAPGDEGIWRVHLDTATGVLGSAAQLVTMASPSWLTRHPVLPVVYATSEVERGGSVQAFAVGTDAGLTPFGPPQAVSGPAACHAVVVGASPGAPGWLMVSNYGGGAVDVFSLAKDGAVRPGARTFPGAGSGPVPRRQEGPHAHFALRVNEQWAVVADLGTDELRRFEITAKGPVQAGVAAWMQPGTGPRHVAVHPGGSYLYVTAELSADVVVLQLDREHGEAIEGERVAASETGRGVSEAPAGPFDLRVENAPSHLALSSDGQVLFVANRGPGTIATFVIERGGAVVEVADEVDAGCPTPRHFAVVPADDGGEWIVVAGQEANLVTVLRRRPGAVALEPGAARLELPQPACILPL